MGIGTHSDPLPPKKLLSFVLIIIVCLGIISNLLFCITLDIDECSQGLCSGKCVNTMGSYHCSCPVGFFYDAEKRICAGMLSIVGLLHEII